MLEIYFSASKMLEHLRSGPSGPHLDGFAAVLERQGYDADTAVRYLRAAAHLGHVVAGQGGMPNDIDLAVFSEHLRACRCPRAKGGRRNHQWRRPIPGIWAPRSAWSPCFILGVKISTIVRMSTASCRAAVCRSSLPRQRLGTGALPLSHRTLPGHLSGLRRRHGLARPDPAQGPDLARHLMTRHAPTRSPRPSRRLLQSPPGLCAPLVEVAARLSPATLHLSVNEPMAPSPASQMVLHRDEGRPLLSGRRARSGASDRL